MDVINFFKPQSNKIDSKMGIEFQVFENYRLKIKLSMGLRDKNL